MCSYNAVNGVPTCANKMLNTILRERWNFSGYITGDTGAVSDIFMEHKYVGDSVNATCVAMDHGGCDVCSGHVYHDSLIKAVTTQACMSNETVLRALRRTLKLRFELGLFDPADAATNPFWHVSADEVQTPASQATNLLASLEAMVLLKNLDATLPLKKGAPRVSVLQEYRYISSECSSQFDSLPLTYLTTPLSMCDFIFIYRDILLRILLTI